MTCAQKCHADAQFMQSLLVCRAQGSHRPQTRSNCDATIDQHVMQAAPYTAVPLKSSIAHLPGTAQNVLTLILCHGLLPSKLLWNHSPSFPKFTSRVRMQMQPGALFGTFVFLLFCPMRPKPMQSIHHEHNPPLGLLPEANPHKNTLASMGSSSSCHKGI